MTKAGAMLLATTLLVACGPTPYRESYRESYLSDRRYFVEVKVNGKTSRGTAMEYLHRRAGELCPIGYEIVDEAHGERVGYVKTSAYTVQRVERPEVSAVIVCRADELGPPGGR